MRDFRYPLAAAVLLGCAALGWALGDFRAFIHFFGIDTQQSDNYDVTSGVGPMVETFLLGSGIFATVWAHVNCHVDRCPRVGRFPVAGGQYKVCRRHNVDVPDRITHDHVIRCHRLHLSGHVPVRVRPADEDR